MARHHRRTEQSPRKRYETTAVVREVEGWVPYRHTLAGLLVRALRPLQPTREEVESALRSQRRSGLAEAIGVERVWAGVSGSGP